MKIKKIVSLSLIILMSCALILPSFAGCGDKTDTGSSTTASAADNSTSASTTSPPDTTTTEPPTTTAPQTTLAADMTGLTSFITEQVTGERNDYDGSLGYEFQCNADMTVTAVGRPLNGEMDDTHTVYIWDVSTKTLMAQADVTPESPLDSLDFKVATLSSPVTFKSGSMYVILCSESNYGDAWFDVGTADNPVPGLSTTADCKITQAAFGTAPNYDAYPSSLWSPGGDNLGYVGVTFYYTLN